jgi:hypothetical protein
MKHNVIKHVSKQDLINLLLNWKFGTQPASIQYLTRPALNKEGKKLFGSIIKLANVGCLIGYNYQNSVNNKLLKENKIRKSNEIKVTKENLSNDNPETNLSQNNSLNNNLSQGNSLNEFNQKSFNNKFNCNKFISGDLWHGKGKRISSCLVQHTEKNTFYLSFKHQQTFKSFYLTDDLTPVKSEVLENYLQGSKPTNQNVNEGSEILHREILIDNIKKIKFKGITYLIT